MAEILDLDPNLLTRARFVRAIGQLNDRLLTLDKDTARPQNLEHVPKLVGRLISDEVAAQQPDAKPSVIDPQRKETDRALAAAVGADPDAIGLRDPETLDPLIELRRISYEREIDLTLAEFIDVAYGYLQLSSAVRAEKELLEHSSLMSAEDHKTARAVLWELAVQALADSVEEPEVSIKHVGGWIRLTVSSAGTKPPVRRTSEESRAFEVELGLIDSSEGAPAAGWSAVGLLDRAAAWQYRVDHASETTPTLSIDAFWQVSGETAEYWDGKSGRYLNEIPRAVPESGNITFGIDVVNAALESSLPVEQVADIMGIISDWSSVADGLPGESGVSVTGEGSRLRVEIISGTAGLPIGQAGKILFSSLTDDHMMNSIESFGGYVDRDHGESVWFVVDRLGSVEYGENRLENLPKNLVGPALERFTREISRAKQTIREVLEPLAAVGMEQEVEELIGKDYFSIIREVFELRARLAADVDEAMRGRSFNEDVIRLLSYEHYLEHRQKSISDAQVMIDSANKYMDRVRGAFSILENEMALQELGADVDSIISGKMADGRRIVLSHINGQRALLGILVPLARRERSIRYYRRWVDNNGEIEYTPVSGIGSDNERSQDPYLIPIERAWVESLRGSGSPEERLKLAVELPILSRHLLDNVDPERMTPVDNIADRVLSVSYAGPDPIRTVQITIDNEVERKAFLFGLKVARAFGSDVADHVVFGSTIVMGDMPGLFDRESRAGSPRVWAEAVRMRNGERQAMIDFVLGIQDHRRGEGWYSINGIDVGSLDYRYAFRDEWNPEDIQSGYFETADGMWYGRRYSRELMEQAEWSLLEIEEELRELSPEWTQVLWDNMRLLDSRIVDRDRNVQPNVDVAMDQLRHRIETLARSLDIPESKATPSSNWWGTLAALRVKYPPGTEMASKIGLLYNAAMVEKHAYAVWKPEEHSEVDQDDAEIIGLIENSPETTIPILADAQEKPRLADDIEERIQSIRSQVESVRAKMLQEFGIESSEYEVDLLSRIEAGLSDIAEFLRQHDSRIDYQAAIADFIETAEYWVTTREMAVVYRVGAGAVAEFNAAGERLDGAITAMREGADGVENSAVDISSDTVSEVELAAIEGRLVNLIQPGSLLRKVNPGIVRSLSQALEYLSRVHIEIPDNRMAEKLVESIVEWIAAYDAVVEVNDAFSELRKRAGRLVVGKTIDVTEELLIDLDKIDELNLGGDRSSVAAQNHSAELEAMVEQDSGTRQLFDLSTQMQGWDPTDIDLVAAAVQALTDQAVQDFGESPRIESTRTDGRITVRISNEGRHTPIRSGSAAWFATALLDAIGAWSFVVHSGTTIEFSMEHPSVAAPAPGRTEPDLVLTLKPGSGAAASAPAFEPIGQLLEQTGWPDERIGAFQKFLSRLVNAIRAYAPMNYSEFEEANPSDFRTAVYATGSELRLEIDTACRDFPFENLGTLFDTMPGLAAWGGAVTGETDRVDFTVVSVDPEPGSTSATAAPKTPPGSPSPSPKGGSASGPVVSLHDFDPAEALDRSRPRRRRPRFSGVPKGIPHQVVGFHNDEDGNEWGTKPPQRRESSQWQQRFDREMAEAEAARSAANESAAGASAAETGAGEHAGQRPASQPRMPRQPKGGRADDGPGGSRRASNSIVSAEAADAGADSPAPPDLVRILAPLLGRTDPSAVTKGIDQALSMVEAALRTNDEAGLRRLIEEGRLDHVTEMIAELVRTDYASQIGNPTPAQRAEHGAERARAISAVESLSAERAERNWTPVRSADPVRELRRLSGMPGAPASLGRLVDAVTVFLRLDGAERIAAELPSALAPWVARRPTERASVVESAAEAVWLLATLAVADSTDRPRITLSHNDGRIVVSVANESDQHPIRVSVANESDQDPIRSDGSVWSSLDALGTWDFSLNAAGRTVTFTIGDPTEEPPGKSEPTVALPLPLTADHTAIEAALEPLVRKLTEDGWSTNRIREVVTVVWAVADTVETHAPHFASEFDDDDYLKVLRATFDDSAGQVRFELTTNSISFPFQHLADEFAAFDAVVGWGGSVTENTDIVVFTMAKGAPSDTDPNPSWIEMVTGPSAFSAKSPLPEITESDMSDVREGIYEQIGKAAYQEWWHIVSRLQAVQPHLEKLDAILRRTVQADSQEIGLLAELFAATREWLKTRPAAHVVEIARPAVHHKYVNGKPTKELNPYWELIKDAKRRLKKATRAISNALAGAPATTYDPYFSVDPEMAARLPLASLLVPLASVLLAGAANDKWVQPLTYSYYLLAQYEPNPGFPMHPVLSNIHRATEEWLAAYRGNREAHAARDDAAKAVSEARAAIALFEAADKRVAGLLGALERRAAPEGGSASTDVAGGRGRVPTDAKVPEGSWAAGLGAGPIARHDARPQDDESTRSADQTRGPVDEAREGEPQIGPAPVVVPEGGERVLTQAEVAESPWAVGLGSGPKANGGAGTQVDESNPIGHEPVSGSTVRSGTGQQSPDTVQIVAPSVGPGDPYVATIGPGPRLADLSIGSDVPVGSIRHGEYDQIKYVSGGTAAISHVGYRHKKNDDALLAAEYWWNGRRVKFIGVFDGVSTAVRGDWAARMAAAAAKEFVDSEMRRLVPGQELDTEALLVGAVGAAQEAVVRLAEQIQYDGKSENAPACTIALAFMDGNTVTVAWVGDSRVYWIRRDGGASKRLTEDDSFLSEIMKHQEVPDEAEALKNGMAHWITACLGPDFDYSPEVRASHVKTHTVEGDGFLLACTDGLWNYAPGADDLRWYVDRALQGQLGDLRNVVLEFVNFALDEGGDDNITVVVADNGATESRGHDSNLGEPIDRADGVGPRTPWSDKSQGGGSNSAPVAGDPPHPVVTSEQAGQGSPAQDSESGRFRDFIPKDRISGRAIDLCFDELMRALRTVLSEESAYRNLLRRADYNLLELRALVAQPDTIVPARRAELLVELYDLIPGWLAARDRHLAGAAATVMRIWNVDPHRKLETIDYELVGLDDVVARKLAAARLLRVSRRSTRPLLDRECRTVSEVIADLESALRAQRPADVRCVKIRATMDYLKLLIDPENRKQAVPKAMIKQLKDLLEQAKSWSKLLIERAEVQKAVDILNSARPNEQEYLDIEQKISSIAEELDHMRAAEHQQGEGPAM
ncbi:serine/threonine-protein phosphatase [Nocardia panacis]|uniref:Serine/threonine-protein phosphatase n=1 Tax=Nocardia panacis TaxID=2340916 RepID=A0A3A4K7Y2_9NOCA|nr:serine/threonine-protein phosphatase [Nocardia panacis]